MLICLITGSPPQGRCGINDFVLKLAASLHSQGVDADIIDHADWSTAGTLRLAARLRRAEPDVLHMQYPMSVGWRSLGPHAIGFLSGVPQVVTIHEFTSFDRLRRASMAAFARSAAKLAFTTEAEARSFFRQFPRACRKAITIPIGSNIPLQPAAEQRLPRTIVYFGQVKPLKGLEDFIALARIASLRQRHWKFQVLGSPVHWAGDYLQRMQESAAGTNLEWMLDCTENEVASLLAGAGAAYLPYPDGVSERRGSLIAALGNGIPVVTTHGPSEPLDIGAAVLFAGTPAEADALLARLFTDEFLERELRNAGSRYAAKFGWDNIAQRYSAVYRAVVDDYARGSTLSWRSHASTP